MGQPGLSYQHGGVLGRAFAWLATELAHPAEGDVFQLCLFACRARAPDRQHAGNWRPCADDHGAHQCAGLCDAVPGVAAWRGYCLWYPCHQPCPDGWRIWAVFWPVLALPPCTDRNDARSAIISQLTTGSGMGDGLGGKVPIQLPQNDTDVKASVSSKAATKLSETMSPDPSCEGNSPPHAVRRNKDWRTAIKRNKQIGGWTLAAGCTITHFETNRIYG